MSLFAELRRRNVIRVALAYVVAGWLLVQVVELAADAFAAPDWVLKLLITLLAIGIVPTLVFAWVYELTPEGLRRESDIAPDETITAHTAKKLDLAVIGLLVAAMGLFAVVHLGGVGRTVAPETAAVEEAPPKAGGKIATTPGEAPDLSIAVLPFVNMSADPENEYFADGLSEELLNVLAQIKGLKVAGRTSSFHFKGRNEDLRQIGETLGVANILEGSVRRQGDRVRITAQLVQASDGFHLWSDTFDRKLDDIFAIQDEISASVAGALRVTLLGESREPAAVGQGIDPEVYSRFIAARARTATRDADKVLEAIEMLRQVTSEAPDFAHGYAALAVAALLAWGNDSTLTADEALPLARGAVRKAVALAPDDDSVLAAQGLLLASEFGIDGDPQTEAASVAALRRAIEVNPENVDARYWLAIMLLGAEKFGEAGRLLDEALALDPLARVARGQRINAYQLQGEFDEARALAEKSIELMPEVWFFYTWAGAGEFARGRPERALLWNELAEARATAPHPTLLFLRLTALFQLGDPEGIAALASSAEAFGTQVADTVAMLRHIEAGELERAIAVMEAGVERDGAADWDGSIFNVAIQAGDCDRALRTDAARTRSSRWTTSDMEVNGTNEFAATLLAHCWQRSDRAAEARQLLEAAVDYYRPKPGRFDAATLRIRRAAALALLGDETAALDELRAYEAAGFGLTADPASWIYLDRDVRFASLHDDPGFRRIMAAIRARNAGRLAAVRAGELTVDTPL